MLEHFHRDVPGLGNVALSRKVLRRAEEFGFSQTKLTDLLWNGRRTPDGMAAVWRDKGGFRLVIVLRPEPYSGACLAVTLFRVMDQR